MESYGVKQATRSRGWKECDEVDEKAAIDFSLFSFSSLFLFLLLFFVVFQN